MKKIVFTNLALLLFLVGSFAKGPIAFNSNRKFDRKDLRKDLRDIHKDRAERKKAFSYGEKTKTKELTRDIKADKKDIREDRGDLKADARKHHEKNG